MARVEKARRGRRHRGAGSGSGRESDDRPACIFCRIVAGEAPASVVFEDARTLAFMDVNPVRPGHLLVIPKAHRAQIWHLSDAEFAAVYRKLPSLVRALAGVTRADAVDVFNLNGPAGGQTVFHLHVHLIPVHRDRSPVRHEQGRVVLEFEQQVAARPELDRLARRIRARLREEPRVGDPRSPAQRESDRRLVVRQTAPNDGVVDWLLACPEKGFLSAAVTRRLSGSRARACPRPRRRGESRRPR